MGKPALSAYERETVINMNDDDRYAMVTTYQKSLLARLRRHPEAELINEWDFMGTPGATFRVPAKFVSVRLPYGSARSAVSVMQQPLVTRMDPIAA